MQGNAATAAENTRLLTGAQSIADKQLSNLQNSITPLKDSSHWLFIKQLKRQAKQCNWPTHIMDIGEADMPPGERANLDPNDVDELKIILHIRNAYTIITSMCDGHQVEHLLESCTDGHAREALDCIREYFNPPTTGGRRNASKKFNNDTMATTHTNVVEWIAMVRHNAELLRQTGGEANNETELSNLLNGLLPEFDRIKHTLDETPNLPLHEADKSCTH